MEIIGVDGNDTESDDDMPGDVQEPVTTTDQQTTAATNGDTESADIDEQHAATADNWGAGFDIDKGKVKRPLSDSTSPTTPRGQMKLIPGPVRPGRKEIEEHLICHIPYADWCSCCVAARALDNKHMTAKTTKSKEVPVVCIDWCFMGQAEDASATAILVVRDAATKSTFAHGTPGKAINAKEYGIHTIRRLLKDFDELGYKKLIPKGDKKASIRALQERIKEAWSGEIILENSPVSSSQSNGVVEKAVQDVEGMVRTCIIALEARLKEKIQTDLPVMQWLIEHSADLIDRFRRGRTDGKTARERRKGKEENPWMAEFGESVHYLPLDRDRGACNEMDPKFLPGVWLGLERGTNEAKIGTTSGVIRARTVRRRPEEERWSAQAIRSTRGVPWEPVPGATSKDVSTAAIVPEAPDKDAVIVEMPAPEPASSRRLKITKEDAKEMGFTKGCQGCRAIKIGGRQQAHNEICRKRLEAHLRSTESGKARIEKQEHRMATAIVKFMDDEVRADQDRSTAESPPGADEAGAGATEDDKTHARPAPEPKPDIHQAPSMEVDVPSQTASSSTSTAIVLAPSAAAPLKRKSDGNDEDRHALVRHEDTSQHGTKRTGGREEQRDGEEPKAPRTWNTDENVTMDAMDTESRKAHMETMQQKLGCENFIGEVYSPPRIAEMARKHGLRGGFSMDFTVPGPDGYIWDFSKKVCRDKAWDMIVKLKPFLLVGSPPCTAFSSLQNFLRCLPGGNEKVDRAIEAAKIHVEFCIKLYKYQIREGRYFLHEHPMTASSWRLERVEEISRSPLVYKTKTHMCRFGMKSEDEQGVGLVKKPTTMMTNSLEVHRELDKQCIGGHRHVQLLGGKAKACAVYPRELCRAVIRGAVRQMELDAADMMSIEVVGECDDVDVMGLDQESGDLEWMKYWDDTNGKELRADLVKAARMEEIKEVRRMKVWTKVPRSQCIAETGKPPIKVRWVDRNKKDDQNPDYRSRIVAKEVKTYANPELFAATPPVEYVKFILSCAASSQWGKHKTRIMIQDVKKAYFFAKATRRIFVDIPEEDREAGDEHNCALLLQSLYGTRDAAMNWAKCYTDALIELGFTKGATSPCTFWHPQRRIRLAVHGDDFVSEGATADLKWLDEHLSKSFDLKTQVLGPEGGQVRECTILNRVLRWTSKGITWEPDARHAEQLIKDLGMEDMKGVCTPGVKESKDKKKDATDEKTEVDDLETPATETTACKPVVSLPLWGGLAVPGLEGYSSREEQLAASGWARAPRICNAWEKKFVGATGMIELPVRGVSRRTTRTADDQILVEDLIMKPGTPEKLITRQFRAPNDIHVVLELADIEQEEKDKPWEERLMAPHDQTRYRASAARVNFLAIDRPDLQYASKESSRRMANPTNGDWQILKRIARYLVNHRRLVHLYEWQDEDATVSIYSDSDWAGCTRTRKSTSGACMFHGSHLIRSFARTQSTIALSSAEAELYATVAAASEALGMKAMMADYGLSAKPHLHVDASAAIGIAQRKGLGKIRHLDTQSLWIQDALRERRLSLNKVKGTENPADAMTKFVDGQTLSKMLLKMNCLFEDGRAASTPQLAIDQGVTHEDSGGSGRRGESGDSGVAGGNSNPQKQRQQQQQQQQQPQQQQQQQPQQHTQHQWRGQPRRAESRHRRHAGPRQVDKIVMFDDVADTIEFEMNVDANLKSPTVAKFMQPVKPVEFVEPEEFLQWG